MNWLSDEAVARLQAVSALPDLGGTRYRLMKRIGSGGMGTVYLAEDSVLGRRVALKVLDVPGAADEFAARLLREAHVLARLEHPGIVPVHDAGTLADGRPFYAMKFVEGERLDQLVQGITSVPERLRLFQKICEAVAFAHAHGILHRDLKPENVMVGPFGEVLVMDWGIAKILNDGPGSDTGDQPDAGTQAHRGQSARAGVTTEHGTVLGTPGFMAPEQARGDVASLDRRADIYSLGAVLRFIGGSDAAFPPAVAAIARKAMAAEPAGRYDSASELEREVGRYLDGLPVAAYPEGAFRRIGRWASKYRVAIILMLTYLVVRAAILFFFRH
jgi:eukaryotic-like serine/threonine-protein kinase